MSCEMPTLSADHQKLHRLAGTWRGEEIMPPSQWAPQGFKAEGCSRLRVATNGFCVVGDYEQEHAGKTTFEGHAVYMWDAAAKEVVLSWWDSMGQGREEFRGGWQGDVLTLTSRNQMGLVRLTYDYATKGRLASRMETSPDGKAWQRVFDGTYTHGD